MHLNKSMNCCGLGEFIGMNDNRFDSRISINMIATKYQNPYGRYDGFGQVIFTLMIPRTLGEDLIDDRKRRMTSLKQYITKNNLGTYVSTDYFTNPNTKNKICTMVWTINQKVFNKWNK